MTAFYLIESRQLIANADGEYLKIRPQSYQVFSLLLDHADTVVSKEQLFESVWTSLAVTDDSITQCIADIRRILGTKHRHLLQTIPKRGYRLSAGGDKSRSPIIVKSHLLPSLAENLSQSDLTDHVVDKPLTQASIPTEVQSADTDTTVVSDHTNRIEELSRFDTLSHADVSARNLPDPTGQTTPQAQPWWVKVTRMRRLQLIVVVLLGVFVGLPFVLAPIVSSYNRSSVSKPDTPSANRTAELPSIAVLPFQNLSGVATDDYLSDGTTEDLITDLSTLSGLLVIARNSISAYKDRKLDSQSVARDLNVRYILNGSVRRSGSRIRINVEITDTDNNVQLWAERYDGELNSIFDMQDEINQSVVNALALKLTLSEKRRLKQRPTENLQAYNLYQQGRFYTFSSQRKLGEEYLRTAIALEPNFSGAYAALAYSHSIAVSFGQSSDIDSELEQAFKLATIAASLDNNSAEANVALAQIFLLRGQHDAALRAGKRAVDSNPSYASAHGIYGWALSLSGNFSEALVSLSRAVRLQPTSNGIVLAAQGATYYFAGRYDEAAAILEISKARNPNNVTSHAFLAATYQRLGRTEDAEWEAEEITVLDPDFKIKEWRWMQAYKNQGDPKFLLLSEDLQAAGLSLE